jgi:glycosyltransferase involved in cell wall biosynthesis
MSGARGAAPAAPMLVSVVTTTYNRPDALRAVLEALAAQDDPRFEVVIADDGSREDTRAMLAGFAAGAAPAAGLERLVHAWHPDEGFRAAAARNMAVAASRGEYLVFLDGDCVPRPDFVSRHRALAERGFMVTGSRVLMSPELTGEVLAGRLPGPLASRPLTWWIAQRLRRRANKALPLLRFGDSPLRRYRTVAWRRVKSCNLAIWRDDYAAVDGFDESFVGWGHEDADLVLRLARHGVRRKGGAFSTEVFHLWHRDNPRGNESENRRRVEARFDSGQVVSTLGLSAHPAAGEDVRVLAGG